MEGFIRVLKKLRWSLPFHVRLSPLCGAFGAPEAMMHRSIHLIFTLLLIFLTGFTGETKQGKQNSP